MTNVSSLSRPVTVASFSTQGLAQHERLAAWRDLFGASYKVEADPASFAAEARLAQFDGMVVHAIDAGAQAVSRTQAQIRRDGLEHISLHLNHAGYEFRSARGDGRMAAGEISINDVARPFERSIASECGSIVLSLPRDAVERVAPDRELHGAVLSGSVAKLLAAHMQMLVSRMNELPGGAARRLMEASVAMLGAALVPGAADSRSLDAARMLAVKRHIRQNLSRLPLGPESIARDLGISRTKLYSLFEPEGGVARYIAVRRLAAAAEALRDPLDFRPISALVVAFGFGSASAFSRAFRSRYGLSASDFRLAPHGEPEDFNRTVYTDWLRQLA